jgi:hypothetical protein
LLEDVARTFAEHGANIVSYGGIVDDQLAKNWYTAEIGDVKDLRGAADRSPQHRGGLRRVQSDTVLVIGRNASHFARGQTGAGALPRACPIGAVGGF